MEKLEKKVCYFCAQNMNVIDYKDTEILRHFISAQAKIMPRKRSHLCATHQRRLARAIKQARTLGIMPYTSR